VNDKTNVSKRRAQKSSESSDWLTPLVPESHENDIIDRARSMEFFASGSPGIGSGK
jgi:hypothetical protein